MENNHIFTNKEEEKQMKNELIQAHAELSQISVAGNDVSHMFFAKSLIENVISQMPDDKPPEKKDGGKPGDGEGQKEGDKQ